MNNEIKYKLHNIDNFSKSELERKVELGAKFVIFNYRVSLGLISLQKISPAIFIKNHDEFIKYRKKYNKLNFILGWWQIPKGPVYVYNSYKLNMNGGIDVTKDIMINISEEYLNEKEILIENIHTIFSKLKKNDITNFRKALTQIEKRDLAIESAYSGLFINVDRYEEPYFVIGVKMQRNSVFNAEIIKKSLLKYYYKHVVFDIFEIVENDDFSEALIEQGDKIF